MVSAPPREPIHQVIHAKSGTQRRWTSLKWIHLDGVELQAEEWKSVMEAIDLSELQTLSFGGSNLSLEGLQLLIDRIPDYANVPLKTLNIKRTPATAKSHLRSLLNMLGKKSSITLY
ncbi:hypothetical protein B0O80DRAFT_460598 [Mortierella sp. GBAus27b]|nr:hypothetical protein B0O80DRAFT_460598 [Mortierella sp. GBAus27b]